MHWIMQDLRYGIRQLRKSPGFALIAVLTLALGIGANTAVFSVVDTVLLRPLPYYQPERLVVVSETETVSPNEELGVAAQEYLDYRDQNRTFSSVAAFESNGFNLTGEGGPLRIHAAGMSASAFPTLGVSPLMGRAFTSEEDRSGSDNVVELSYSLWQHQYHGDPNILGRTVKLDEKPYTVIGVMPPSFHFPFDGKPFSEMADLWLPIGFSAEVLAPQNRMMEFGVGLIGRIKPGVTREQSQQDVQHIADVFQQAHPDSYSANARVMPHVHAFSAYTVEKARPLLLLLSAAVICVLLIACANVANLLLARASSRSREMAIRSAVGARRTALLRQCLVESSLLSLLGGCAGTALAVVSVAGLRNFGPASVPRLHEITIHPLALLFTLGLSVLTTILFGFMPAWRLSHVSPQSFLKDSAQTGSSRSNQRLQNAVAVGEIALALVLLIAGSLLVRSFLRLLDTPLGFDPKDAFVVRTIFDTERYPDPVKRMAVQKELLSRLARLPGVTTVAAASHLPLSDERGIGFHLEHAAPDDFHFAQNSLVTPGYFRAMGIGIREGRDFSEQDSPSSPLVAIISETMARQYFHGQEPIGQRFNWGDRGLFTIVGVAEDVHISALDADPPPMIYQSMFQMQTWTAGHTAFLLRTNRAGQDLFSEVQQQVWSIDKELPLYNSTTLATVVSDSLEERRFTMMLLAAFSGVALLLAAIGLFGVISYLVSQHQREMALRMALGADRADIHRMVLLRGTKLGIAGCAIGFLLALAGSRLLATSLYHVSRFDPATLVLVPVLLLSVVLLAVSVPARRAASLDPMQALRAE
jgi:putative ABC transport system permease protein